MSVTALRRTGLWLVGISLATLVGCASEDGDASVEDREPATAERSTEEQTRVSCGGGRGWEVSAMSGGIDSRFDRAELAAALAQLAKDAGIDAPQALQDVDIEDARWIVLAEGNGEVTIGTGSWTEEGPGDDGQTVGLRRGDHGWSALGWGDCSTLAPVLDDGLAWVEVRAAPGLDPASTELDLLVNERQCSSARDPEAHLHEPRLVEDTTSVTVYWTSDAAEGLQRCPGNAQVPRSLELDSPLGDRELRDGSHWPPRPIANRR